MRNAKHRATERALQDCNATVHRLRAEKAELLEACQAWDRAEKQQFVGLQYKGAVRKRMVEARRRELYEAKERIRAAIASTKPDPEQRTTFAPVDDEQGGGE